MIDVTQRMNEIDYGCEVMEMLSVNSPVTGHSITYKAFRCAAIKPLS